MLRLPHHITGIASQQPTGTSQRRSVRAAKTMISAAIGKRTQRLMPIDPEGRAVAGVANQQG